MRIPPSQEIPPVPADQLARPPMARPHHHRGADLVQRRSARRQPGADRADGRRSASCACSRRSCSMGFKEIEVGFPVGLADRFRLLPPAHRGRPHSRRRHDPGADPGARASDRAHLRSRCIGAKRAIVHLYNSTSTAAAPRRLRPGHGRHHRHRRQRRATGCANCAATHAGAPSSSFQYSPESFTGTELDFAIEICEAVMDVWQPTPDNKMHPQPAGHGRDGDAERLRRPDRVVLPQPQEPRQRHHQPAYAQRSRHRRRRDGARPAGGRRPRRRHAVRQRRAHRQRRHRHAGA